MDRQSPQPDAQLTDEFPSADSSSIHPGSPPKTLGAELHAVRMDRGVSLEHMALETHISLRLLQGLEEDKYNDLPGGMYNRAFLRKYCEYLGLVPDAYLERMEREQAPHSEKLSKPKAPSPHLPSRGYRLPPLAVWSMMFVASVIGLYFSRGWITSVFSPYFAHAPSAPLGKADAIPAPIAGKEDAASSLANTAPAGTQAPQLKDATAVSASAQAVVEERPPGALRLQFQVDQECWISVTADGIHLVSRILQPGESAIYDAENRFYLILGNAGGVSLRINGEPARPLGKPGEVIRLLINEQNVPDLIIKRIDGPLC
jgi:cytoskeleton protein RodZ